MLARDRLITLAGPGGVGKTRVALELARRAEVDYDAVAVVDLVELSAGEADAAAVERALVSTLDVVGRSAQTPAMDVLIDYLGSKRVLLVLDNCEHLWQAVGDVVTVLLQEASGLTVVATSRRHLEAAGEHVLHVPALAIPPASADRDQTALSDSEVLLLDRACAAGWPLAAGDIDSGMWNDIVELVRWSGGLPLVVELIAVRLGGGLSPATIRQRLDGGQLLKAPGRRMLPHHQTLGQVLDWSYGLCSAGEQRLWARLSVFTGGFDLAMAEEVCGDPGGAVATPAVLDLLTNLVRQSIVIAEPDGRFRQLPPIREYGLRQLQAFGEQDTTGERLCAYLCRLVADAAEHRCSPVELDTLRHVYRELPNIRAALAYCATPRRAATGLRMTTDLAQLGFSFFSAFLDEICAWVETFLDLTSATPSPDRVEALAMLALMRLWQGDRQRANCHRIECLDQARRLPTANDPPIATFQNGMYLFLAHNDPACLEPLKQSCDAFAAQDSRSAEFRARIWLAIAAGFLAPEDTAEQAAAETLAYAQAHGGPWSKSWGLWVQGRAARVHPQAAMALLQQALRMLIDMGNQPVGVNICVETIAWEWAALGQAVPAARLLGAVSGTEHNSSVAIGGLGPFHHERQRAISRIHAALDDETYTEAFHYGHKLNADEIYTLALSDPTAEQNTTTQTRNLPLDALTTHQQQIAQLVTQGLSDKNIATKLRISQGTVENHLGQIFTRLDLHNRTQIAAWVRARSWQAVHHTIMVVDVAGFSGRRMTRVHQVAIRDGLYAALERAFGESGIGWDGCYYEDRGDGVLILAPAQVPKASFAVPLPGQLAAALSEHNAAHDEYGQIRLRVALHAGEVSHDQHGVTGDAINLAFRLVDAQPLKDALAASPGMLALIASPWFYEEVIRHQPSAQPATWRPHPVAVKETATTGWIALPDHPYPPCDPAEVIQPRTGPVPPVPRRLSAGIASSAWSRSPAGLAGPEETTAQPAEAVGAQWRSEESESADSRPGGEDGAVFTGLIRFIAIHPATGLTG